jgi:hypothetical protein
MTIDVSHREIVEETHQSYLIDRKHDQKWLILSWSGREQYILIP